MSTDVVKAIDVAISIFDQNELEVGNIITQVVTGLFESHTVCYDHPFPGEYSSSLELIHLF